jgi:hypothetical protein
MSVHVIAIYKPNPGQQIDLEREVAAHVPELRRLGLATNAASTALRASDGTILEHFEWVSSEAIDKAHEHPDVHKMWARFESCCTYGTLEQLPNAGVMFPEFEYLGSY